MRAKALSIGRYAVMAGFVWLQLLQTACSFKAGTSLAEATSLNANNFTLGGTLSGLDGNLQLANANELLNLQQNGPFAFAQTFSAQQSYAVSITQAPTTQNCLLQNANGIFTNSDINSIRVVCGNGNGNGNGNGAGNTSNYQVGGTVSGLLQNNTVSLALTTPLGVDTITINGNGYFVWDQTFPAASIYSAAVSSQPLGQTCVIFAGTGMLAAVNINDVQVACFANTYKVGLQASGINGSVTVVNGTDVLTISSNGNYYFPTALNYQNIYNVSIQSSPATLGCSLSNASNLSVPTSNSMMTQLMCSSNNLYSLQGVALGLTGGNVTLLNEALTFTLSSNGSFTFPQAFISGSTYNVSLDGNYAQLCTLSNNSGTFTNSNITTLAVNCQQALVFLNNPNATAVLGQTLFSSNSTAAPPTNNSLNNPSGTFCLANANNLYVADTLNNRVLGFTLANADAFAATATAPAASVVLGQSAFGSATASTTATGMHAPADVHCGSSNALWVADTQNNRLLWFNQPPTDNNAAANGVVGQSNFTTAASGCTATSLNQPKQVLAYKTMLMVADTANNRVLVWNNANNALAAQAPNVVLGQTNLTSCAVASLSATSLAAPIGLFSDGNQLYVADSNNNRVLIYSNLGKSHHRPSRQYGFRTA